MTKSKQDDTATVDETKAEGDPGPEPVVIGDPDAVIEVAEDTDPATDDAGDAGEGEGDPAADPDPEAEPEAELGDPDPDRVEATDPPPDDEEVAEAAPEVATEFDEPADQGPSSPETGEPTISNQAGFNAATDPHNSTPEDIGAAMIMMLDNLDKMMTTEAGRRQPEILAVLQLYRAERPSIIERQRRLAVRANQA